MMPQGPRVTAGLSRADSELQVTQQKATADHGSSTNIPSGTVLR